MRPIPRPVLAGLLAAEVLGVLWLVLNPSSATPSGAVRRVSSLMFRVGFPDRLADPRLVEFGLNVLLFIPLAALCALLWPRIRLWAWILAGFLLSSTLEWIQLELLSDRNSTSRDIIANTLGTIVGATVVCWTRWVRQVWRQDRETTGLTGRFAAPTRKPR